MFCLLTLLDDFRGAKVSCRRGPELSYVKDCPLYFDIIEFEIKKLSLWKHV
jgi:hypothetical protein